jgi:hypothetical protein
MNHIPRSNVLIIGGGIRKSHGGYVPLLLSEGLGASSSLAAETAAAGGALAPKMGRGQRKSRKVFSLKI